MKEKIHPKYVMTTVKCACGNAFETMSTAGGVTKEKPELTYRWLCWEYDAIRCRTSWCEVAREMPSTPNVNATCSRTEACPIERTRRTSRRTSLRETSSPRSEREAGE